MFKCVNDGFFSICQDNRVYAVASTVHINSFFHSHILTHCGLALLHITLYLAPNHISVGREGREDVLKSTSKCVHGIHMF